MHREAKILFLAGCALFSAWQAGAQNKMHRDSHVEPIEMEYGVARFFQVDASPRFDERPMNSIPIQDYINPYIPSGSTLDLTDTSASLAGYHYIFEQHINAIDVFGTRVAVNTDKNGNIVSVLSRVFDPTTILPGRSFPDEMDVLDWCKLHWNQGTYRLRATYYYTGTNLVPAYVAEIRKNDLVKLFILDQNLFTLYEDDLNTYAQETMQDSTVNAYVFWPDPVTRAGVNYGPPYVDNNDMDALVLNNERELVSFMAGRDANGTYNLNGPHVQIADFSSPSSSPLQSPLNQWDYTRSNQEFEEINAYYHLDFYIRYVQSLGFNQVMNYAVPVDVHALQGADNAMFSPNGNGEGQLFFGEGGVDDAEDPDVIIHELGHALSNNISASNMGNERRTIDEAIGDYTAVSYTASIENFQTDRVFSWDGHNEYWNGRMCTTSKCHDQLSFSGSIYQHTDVWCAALADIATSIGRSKTDQLLFESMFSYNVNMTMKDAAHLFVLADSLVNGGAHFASIASAFATYCLYDNPVGSAEFGTLPGWEMKNSLGFTEGEYVEFVNLGIPSDGVWVVYDSSGRCVHREQIQSKSILHFAGAQLRKGLYMVHIIPEIGKPQSFKIMR